MSAWWRSDSSAVPGIGEVSARRIFGLAIPALGVLAAMPLYLLWDTAVVGRVGIAELAALGVGAAVHSVVTTQLTFLSYGTTSRAAHFFGAGQRQLAVKEGVQATWVALAVGVVLLGAVSFLASPIARWLTSSAEVAGLAASWLRVASWAIPLTLVEMAGNGWLRGVQDTKKPLYFTLAGLIPGAITVPVFVHYWSIVGSAVALVVGMGIIAGLFLRELYIQHSGSWSPDFSIMAQQLVLGRDLIVRSLAFQVALISATVVVGRWGSQALAAHQIMTQLWNFLTLVLDSLAIAAQSLIGAALGAGAGAQAKAAAVRICIYSALSAVVLAVVFTVGAGDIPRLFTSSSLVLEAFGVAWWIMVGMIVLGGVLFALDGVLLGAGDASFLRTLTLVAVVCGYLPGIWVAYVWGIGLAGVWAGLGCFIVIRMLGVLVRFRSGKWMKV